VAEQYQRALARQVDEAPTERRAPGWGEIDEDIPAEDHIERRRKGGRSGDEVGA
jgi:hypothetical protein